MEVVLGSGDFLLIAVIVAVIVVAAHYFIHGHH